MSLAISVVRAKTIFSNAWRTLVFVSEGLAAIEFAALEVRQNVAPTGTRMASTYNNCWRVI